MARWGSRYQGRIFALKSVYFNDTFTCRYTLTAVGENYVVEAVFSNQHGKTILEASLFGVLPNAREQFVRQGLLDTDPLD